MRTFLAIMLTTVAAAVVPATGSVTAHGQKPVIGPIRQVQPANAKIMIVHGGTQARPQQQMTQIESKPVPLTNAEKSALSGFTLAQINVNTPFTLTPAHPTLASKGALLFENASAVNTESNPSAAFFKSQSDYPGNGLGVINDKALTVLLDHLTAGKHYLIDCTVSAGETYYVNVLPGNLKQSFSGTNHVVVLLEAGADYAEISIAGKAKNLYWFFYSVEVTRLD